MTALSFLLVSKQCKEWKTTFLSSFKNHLRARLKVTPSASLTYFEIHSLTGKPSGLDAFFSVSGQPLLLRIWKYEQLLYCAACTFSMLRYQPQHSQCCAYRIVLLMVCCFALKKKKTIKSQKLTCIKQMEEERYFSKAKKGILSENRDNFQGCTREKSLSKNSSALFKINRRWHLISSSRTGITALLK